MIAATKIEVQVVYKNTEDKNGVYKSKEIMCWWLALKMMMLQIKKIHFYTFAKVFIKLS